MSKHIVEETPAKGSHAQGDNPVEKQASQLAYDVKYKVKQQLNKGTKLNPAQVAKAYMAQLAKSPAPPAVKALAKKKLIGEEYTSDVASLAEKAMVNAMVKVFVEGIEEKVEEVQEEVKEKQYKIRVTDKKTGNTYVRMASRAKIAELRANPNISSVEMTGYGSITGDEKSKGKQTAAAKAGKDYDGDGKVESGAKEYRGAVHNAIQRKKGLKPDGKDTSSVKEEVIYEKEGDIPEKKITGKGVNNKKIIKVFPNSMTEQAPVADKVDPAQKRREQQNDRARQQEVQILQKKLQALRSSPKGSDPSIMASYEAEGEVVEQKVCDKCGKSPCECDKEDAREMPTKMDLFKNKLRARGIKVAGITPAPRNMKVGDELGGESVDEGLTDLQRRRYLGRRPDESKERLKRSNERKAKKAALAALKKHAKGMKAGIYDSYEAEGEMTEEASDRARDEHQMRGGMAARKDYDRPPAKKLSNKELGIRDFTPAEKAKRAKEMAAHLKKMK